MSPARRLQTAWALCSSLLGCSTPQSYLFVEPGTVGPRVELRQPVGLWRRTEVPLPLDDCAFFEVSQSPETAAAFPVEVWRVLSLSPDRTTLEVRYGAVPEGFLQVTPAEGPAPALAPGHLYSVECSGEGIGLAEFVIPAGGP
jgi:hypothetical protein